MKEGQMVKLAVKPKDMRDPVEVGTLGVYLRPAHEPFHWVHFDATENAQTMRIEEITPLSEEELKRLAEENAEYWDNKEAQAQQDWRDGL